ncbi:MAG: response regulator transcription factor [Firmicutes bacterium]|nr:response regulator transcription factor [Bacillota bacterium]
MAPGENKGVILVVDDEEKIRSLIRKYAEFEGYTVKEAADGMQAVQMAEEEDFDIIIMDVMMPELDGFSACREIRKHKQTPVLMLSARGEEYDKIHGFELGVDDYVVKPFSPRELMMRINVIVSRRQAPAPAVHEVAQFGGLVIDFAARLVYVDGVRTDLSPKVYELLHYLVKNKGIALTREQIINTVWGYDFYGDDRTLDTHIKLLRLSLGPYRNYIVTLRGVGYRFEA